VTKKASFVRLPIIIFFVAASFSQQAMVIDQRQIERCRVAVDRKCLQTGEQSDLLQYGTELHLKHLEKITFGQIHLEDGRKLVIPNVRLCRIATHAYLLSRLAPKD
jgi:hypothetical protein